jgi:hypothetical protein
MKLGKYITTLKDMQYKVKVTKVCDCDYRDEEKDAPRKHPPPIIQQFES